MRIMDSDAGGYCGIFNCGFLFVSFFATIHFYILFCKTLKAEYIDKTSENIHHLLHCQLWCFIVCISSFVLENIQASAIK